jgi:NAD(P)-dependent dehydrogenase (short-subunit alcohol dehydrogenase family)
MAKTWLITGCSSGIGRALATAALDRGDQVVVIARRAEKLQPFEDLYPGKALAAPADVTRPGDPRRVVEQALDRFGRIDVLVNNAGFGMVGAIEEAEPQEYRPIFETNLFGAIEMCRAVLPTMRAQRSGRIVNIASIAGITGRAGFGYYNASKFALVGMSEALAGDVAPLGIAVIIAELGMFRTAFLKSNIVAEREIEDYAASAGTARRFDPNNASLHKPADPSRGAAVILKAVDSDDPPLHLPIGPDSFERIRQKLRMMDEQISAWEEVASDVGFVA